MLFNSLEFLVFFPVVTLLYFLLPYRFRWAHLLFASCVFYMAFVPVYIVILGATIVVDYAAGIYIERTDVMRKKKLYLVISIVVTCLILFVFKYYNFFNSNFEALAHFLGWNYPLRALSILLPIGLSFHTFQSLSYVIEVYKGRQKAERHFGIYSLYVMFYPQLVAGPIERPQNLLWQFRLKHKFQWERFSSGMRLILWGMFKKVVIADNLAKCVNTVFDDPSQHTGFSVLVAVIFFSFQIYCDFSGYSHIAIGTARVMGIELMKNFNNPYFASSIKEFWSRWHISLSTWFRDYVYIPLGGSRVSTGKWIRNLFIVFLLSGVWHGANWTFIVWGALHGLFVVIEALYSKAAPDKKLLPRFASVLITFSIVSLIWIFFRAESMSSAYLVLKNLFSFGSLPHNFLTAVNLFGSFDLAVNISLIFLLLATEHFFDFEKIKIAFATRPILRLSTYIVLFILFALFGVFQDSAQFIYFQF